MRERQVPLLRDGEPLGARGCLVMYASYLVLFAKLFIDNYILNLKKKKVEHSKGQ